MAEKVIRFKCDFCGRLFAREHNCVWHENNRCPRNPIQMACLTCNFFHSKDTSTEWNSEEKPCCTNKCVPWQHHCEGWEERQKTWSLHVPFITDVLFQTPQSRDYDDSGCY